jgi:uncharacterized protein YycO
MSARILTLALSVCATLIIGCQPSCDTVLKPGDVLFQDLASRQGVAVKLATGSEYTHCGILFEQGGKQVVMEAVGPVRMIPLADWIAQGVDSRYVVKRLDTLYGYLTPKALAQMKAVGSTYLGRPYDAAFNWSDDELYCSELVWKVYYEGFGLPLCELRRLGSYNFSHPEVAAQARERYGDSIPGDEPVVAPSDLFESERLRLVLSN